MDFSLFTVEGRVALNENFVFISKMVIFVSSTNSMPNFRNTFLIMFVRVVICIFAYFEPMYLNHLYIGYFFTVECHDPLSF